MPATGGCIGRAAVSVAACRQDPSDGKASAAGGGVGQGFYLPDSGSDGICRCRLFLKRQVFDQVVKMGHVLLQNGFGGFGGLVSPVAISEGDRIFFRVTGGKAVKPVKPVFWTFESLNPVKAASACGVCPASET